MQPFRLRLDAREWFKDLRDQRSFKVDFDAFYFCFMAGVATKCKKEVALSETAELVAHFPDRYSSRGKSMVGLFLKVELDSLGVSMDERSAVNSTVARLVNPDSQHFLSDEGLREFNRYAHGGYERLREWFDGDRPRSLETFLRIFKSKLDESLQEEKNADI